ncbi:MAG: ATP-binding cassette domain-containing protein [Nitrospinae bacterium]|nr:ATP-binding cassette domain-containing protein [Nitrospinota bacterium]
MRPEKSATEETRAESAVALESLTRRFGDITAVDSISLEISYGEIFGLLGPNGAGKSTTIKILTTLLEKNSGSARVAGFDVAEEPSEVRNQIGYVPQALSADGGLTAWENLTLTAKLYDIPARERAPRINDTLGFIGLAEFADRLVKTFSGGMIRRLELAMAMLHRPRILFLDEPTIGLDPVAKRAMWEKLLELKKGYGMTILLTTHDMDEADLLCDRLAIMHKGRITASGTPAGLKASVGEGATLEDVFARYSKGVMTEGGSYRDVRQARRTLNRLG